MARKSDKAVDAQAEARAICMSVYGGHRMVNVANGKGDDLQRCSRCDSVEAVNGPHQMKSKTIMKMALVHKVPLTRKDGADVEVWPWTINGR